MEIIEQEEKMDQMQTVEQEEKMDQMQTSNSIKEVQKFLDDMKEGVLALDEDGIILYINESIKKFFQKDVIGKKYSEVVDTNDEVIKSLEDSHMQTLKILASTRTSEQGMREKLKITQKNFIDLMMTFVKVIESHDQYLQGHSARVARYAMMLAKKSGVPAEQIQSFAYAGLFHDLGMILVPREIINKATSLSIKEYVEVKKHPVSSVDYIKNIDLFKNIIPIVLYHHERWDGEGYPMKLKGNAIPLNAQILAVAEAYDTMITKRPYRRARTKEEAIKILKENRGIQFPPEVLDNFLFLLENKII